MSSIEKLALLQFLHLLNNVHCLNEQASDSVTQKGSMEPGNNLVSFVLLLVSASDGGDCLSSDKCDHEQLLSALNGFGACTGIGAYTFHIPFIYLSYIFHCKTGGIMK